MSAATMPGVGWIRQAWPFHLSASVRCCPEPVSSKPNAVQAEDAGQATLARRMFPPPGGLGVDWMLQAVPSHRSARVPWSDPPAARQAEGPVQDTPARDA